MMYRLCALDATEADDALREGAIDEQIAALEGEAFDRILLFGEVAMRAGGMARRVTRGADEAYLDDAAAWLLSGGRGRPPPRPPRSGVWNQAVAVTTESIPPPLIATDRALEVAGGVLLMAVPRKTALDREDLDNARIWICGGEDAPVLEDRSGHPVIAPGALGRGGGRLILELNGVKLVARTFDANGRKIAKREFDLTANSVLSIQGSN